MANELENEMMAAIGGVENTPPTDAARTSSDESSSGRRVNNGQGELRNDLYESMMQAFSGGEEKKQAQKPATPKPAAGTATKPEPKQQTAPVQQTKRDRSALDAELSGLDYNGFVGRLNKDVEEINRMRNDKNVDAATYNAKLLDFNYIHQKFNEVKDILAAQQGVQSPQQEKRKPKKYDGKYSANSTEDLIKQRDAAIKAHKQINTEEEVKKSGADWVRQASGIYEDEVNGINAELQKRAEQERVEYNKKKSSLLSDWDNIVNYMNNLSKKIDAPENVFERSVDAMNSKLPSDKQIYRRVNEWLGNDSQYYAGAMSMKGKAPEVQIAFLSNYIKKHVDDKDKYAFIRGAVDAINNPDLVFDKNGNASYPIYVFAKMQHENGNMSDNVFKKVMDIAHGTGEFSELVAGIGEQYLNSNVGEGRSLFKNSSDYGNVEKMVGGKLALALDREVSKQKARGKELGDQVGNTGSAFRDEDDIELGNRVEGAVSKAVDYQGAINGFINSINPDDLTALLFVISRQYGGDVNKAYEKFADWCTNFTNTYIGKKYGNGIGANFVGGIRSSMIGNLKRISDSGLAKLYGYDDSFYNAALDKHIYEMAEKNLGNQFLQTVGMMTSDAAPFAGYNVVSSSLMKLATSGAGKALTWATGRYGMSSMLEGVFARTVTGRAIQAGLHSGLTGFFYGTTNSMVVSVANGEGIDFWRDLKEGGKTAIAFVPMGATSAVVGNTVPNYIRRTVSGTGKAATAARNTALAFNELAIAPGVGAVGLVLGEAATGDLPKFSTIDELLNYGTKKFVESFGMHIVGRAQHLKEVKSQFNAKNFAGGDMAGAFTKEELTSMGYDSIGDLVKDLTVNTRSDSKTGRSGVMDDVAAKQIEEKVRNIVNDKSIVWSARAKLAANLVGGNVATPTINKVDVVKEGDKTFVYTYDHEGNPVTRVEYSNETEATNNAARLRDQVMSNRIELAKATYNANNEEASYKKAVKDVASSYEGGVTEEQIEGILSMINELRSNGDNIPQSLMNVESEVYSMMKKNMKDFGTVEDAIKRIGGEGIEDIINKPHYDRTPEEVERLGNVLDYLLGEGSELKGKSTNTGSFVDNTPKETERVQTEDDDKSKNTRDAIIESFETESEGGRVYNAIGQGTEVIDGELQTPERKANETNTEKPVETPEEKPVGKASTDKPAGIEDVIAYSGMDEGTAEYMRSNPTDFTEEVENLEHERQQSIAYANGEQVDKPASYDYWKGELGLQEKQTETPQPQDDFQPSYEEGVKYVEIVISDGDMNEDFAKKLIKNANEMISHPDLYDAEMARGMKEATQKWLDENSQTPAPKSETPQPTVVKEGKPVEAEKPSAPKSVATEETPKAEAKTEETPAEPKEETPSFKKGDELVMEHDGKPVTVVVDNVGKNGNITKSHVKDSGKPYHSRGKVVYSPEVKAEPSKEIPVEKEPEKPKGNSVLEAANEVAERVSREKDAKRLDGAIADIDEKIKNASTPEEKAELLEQKQKEILNFVEAHADNPADVVVVKDNEEFKTRVSSTMHAALDEIVANGGYVAGVFDSRSNKVVLNAEGLHSAESVEGVLVHEQSHMFCEIEDGSIINKLAKLPLDKLKEVAKAVMEVARGDYDFYVANTDAIAVRDERRAKRYFADEIAAHAADALSRGKKLPSSIDKELQNELIEHYEKSRNYFRGRKSHDGKRDGQALRGRNGLRKQAYRDDVRHGTSGSVQQKEEEKPAKPRRSSGRNQKEVTEEDLLGGGTGLEYFDDIDLLSVKEREKDDYDTRENDKRQTSAPFYRLSAYNDRMLEGVRSSKEYREFISRADEISDALGLDGTVDHLLGGYTLNKYKKSERYISEPSVQISFGNADYEKVKLYSCLMADLAADEVQESVIPGRPSSRTSKNTSCIEISFNLFDKFEAAKLFRDRNIDVSFMELNGKVTAKALVIKEKWLTDWKKRFVAESKRVKAGIDEIINELKQKGLYDESTERGLRYLETELLDGRDRADVYRGWLENNRANGGKLLNDKAVKLIEQALGIAEGYDGIYRKNSKGLKWVQRQARRYEAEQDVKQKAEEDVTRDDTTPTMFSVVKRDTKDKKLQEVIKEFDEGEYIPVYRAMQVIDGKLYPPMAARIGGELVEGCKKGDILVSDEHPEQIFINNYGVPTRNAKGKLTYKGRGLRPVSEMIIGKDGKYYWKEEKPENAVLMDSENPSEPAYQFKLDKGGRDATGKKATDVPARYNPYWHTSNSVLNDQFKSAWIRPNMVVVKCYIPKSELTSNYKAEYAKDHVGLIPWKSGSVTGELVSKGHPGREVYLSRYCMIGDVVSEEECAKEIKNFMNGIDVEIPINTVTPKLRAELEKVGVKIGPPEKGVNLNEQIREALDKGLQVDNSLLEDVGMFSVKGNAKSRNGISLAEREERDKAELEELQGNNDYINKIEKRENEVDELLANLTSQNSQQSHKSSLVGSSRGNPQNSGYSITNKSKHGSVADGAKLGKKFVNPTLYEEKLASFINKVLESPSFDNEKFQESLIEDVFGRKNDTRLSDYVHLQFSNSDKIVFRVSNHPANAPGMIKRGAKSDKGYSVVIWFNDKPTKKFSSSSHEHVDVREYVYENPDKERLVKIAKSILGLIDGGYYVDFAKADEIHISPRLKDNETLIDRYVTDSGEVMFSVRVPDEYNAKRSEVDEEIGKEVPEGRKELRQLINDSRKKIKDLYKLYLNGDPALGIQKREPAVSEDIAKMNVRIKELEGEANRRANGFTERRNEQKAVDLMTKIAELESNGQGDSEEATKLREELNGINTFTKRVDNLKVKIGEMKAKRKSTSDMAKELYKYIKENISIEMEHEMGKQEFDSLMKQINDIANSDNSRDQIGKFAEASEKVDRIATNINLRIASNILAELISIKTRKSQSGKSVGVKVDAYTAQAIKVAKDFIADMGNDIDWRSLYNLEMEHSDSMYFYNYYKDLVEKGVDSMGNDATPEQIEEAKERIAFYEESMKEYRERALSEGLIPGTVEEANKKAEELFADITEGEPTDAQKAQLAAMPFIRMFSSMKATLQKAKQAKTRAADKLEKAKEVSAREKATRAEIKTLEGQIETAEKSQVGNLEIELEAKKSELESLKVDKRNKLYEYKQAMSEYDGLMNDAVQNTKGAVMELNGLIENGKSKLAEAQEKKVEQRRAFIKIAYEAVATGKPDAVTHSERKKVSEEEKKAKRSSDPINFLTFGVAQSLQHYLTVIDINHLAQQGPLYHHIIKGERGFHQSYMNLIEHREAINEELREANKKFFGKESEPKDRKKKFKFTMRWYDENGEMFSERETEGTKGDMLTVYLWSRSKEGLAKLRAQGFSDETIQEIKAGLGDNWVEYGEWLQDKFLPKLYEKYNKKYIEKFNTNLTKNDKYFPFKIYGPDVVSKVELEDLANNVGDFTPSALKERTSHSYSLDTGNDAFDILTDHINNMEEWYHYADYREDLSALLSSRAVRNELMKQGAKVPQRLRDAILVGSGLYDKNVNDVDRALRSLNKGFATAAISGKFWTALKQLQSVPAFYTAYSDPKYMAILTKNIVSPLGILAIPFNAAGKETRVYENFITRFKWCYDNLPEFRTRVRGGHFGEVVFDDGGYPLFDKFTEKLAFGGMLANKAVDALAVSIGSFSVYEYRFKKYLDEGYDREKADRMAKVDAQDAFNQSQQSSLLPYKSKMQASRNLITSSLTRFMTSPIGFLRKGLQGAADVRKAYRLWRKGKLSLGQATKAAAWGAASGAFTSIGGNYSWYLLGKYGLFGMYNFLSNIISGESDEDKLPKGVDGKTLEELGLYSTSEDDAKNLWSLTYTWLTGTPIGNAVDGFVQRGSYEPVMLFDWMIKSAKDFTNGNYGISDSIENEEYDEVAKQVGGRAIELMLRGFGVDTQTIANLYNGAMGLKEDGTSSTAVSFLLSSPVAHRKEDAIKKGVGLWGNDGAADIEEYIARRIYADARNDIGGKGSNMIDEIFKRNATPKLIDRYIDEWAQFKVPEVLRYKTYMLPLENALKKPKADLRRGKITPAQYKAIEYETKLKLGYNKSTPETRAYEAIGKVMSKIRNAMKNPELRKKGVEMMNKLQEIANMKGHTNVDFVRYASDIGAITNSKMMLTDYMYEDKYIDASQINQLPSEYIEKAMKYWVKKAGSNELTDKLVPEFEKNFKTKKEKINALNKIEAVLEEYKPRSIEEQIIAAMLRNLVSDQRKKNSFEQVFDDVYTEE